MHGVRGNGPVNIPDIDALCANCGTKYGDHYGIRCPTKPADSWQEIPVPLKLDTGKAKWALLPWVAMEQVALVMTFGAEKYSAHGWRKGIEYSRLLSACFRHLTAWVTKQGPDVETGLSHLAHAAFCILALLEYEVDGREGLDDRWEP
jgi:hypothetical protein